MWRICIIFIFLAIMGCQQESTGQREAKIAFYVADYDGSDREDLRILLREYASKYDFDLLDGSGKKGDWGYLVNIVLENDQSTRIWVNTGIDDKTLKVLFFSNEADSFWKPRAHELRRRFREQFGPIEDISAHGRGTGGEVAENWDTVNSQNNRNTN